jgi:ureidoglycolate lyase
VDTASPTSSDDRTAIIELIVETATPANIAPFGELVGGAAFPVIPPSAFYDEVRTYRPSFISDEQTEIAVCALKRRPLRVRWMERHFKHTQVFLPLGAKPFIAVLAPPTETDLPNIADARAFLFDGHAGLSMHIGTWHEFPFALVDDTQLIVVLRTDATKGLLKENIIDGEGVSPDLDKKDITRRLGIVLCPRF